MRTIRAMILAMVIAASVSAMAADDATLKNAPKDAIAIIHVDGKALAAYVKKVEEGLKKKADIAELATIPNAFGALQMKVDAIDVYVTMGEKGPGVTVLLKTGSGVSELYATIQGAKLPMPLPKELTAGENGQYTAKGLPMVIVEGKSAPEVGAGYVAITMDPAAMKSLKAGAGEKLAGLAKKVDTAAPIWAVADLAFAKDEEAPVAVSVALYPGEKKTSTATLTFGSEAAAAKTVETFAKRDRMFTDLASAKQDKADVTFSAVLDDAFAEKVVAFLERARELARRAASAANLSAIGKAVAMYEALKDDKQTTADPNELIKENLVGADAFFKPGSDRKAEKDDKGRLKNKPDYVIFDLPMDAPADMVKAYEPVELNGGKGGNVLFKDSHVQWMKADDLKAAVAKTEKYLKDAKTKK